MRWLNAIAELVLMVWFIAIACDAAFQRAFVDRDSPFRIGEFHHAYLGVGLVVLGFCLGTVTGLFVQLLGIALTVDDLYQHKVQTIDGRFRFQSPLHQLFARYLWPLPAVQWICAFLDRWWFVGVVLGLLAVWLLT